MRNKFIEFLTVVAITTVFLLAGMAGVWLENDITMLVFVLMIFVIPLWVVFLANLLNEKRGVK